MKKKKLRIMKSEFEISQYHYVSYRIGVMA